MSICNIILGGTAIVVSTKFFAELVRTGNATIAGWSTLQSVGEVTAKMANATANAGNSIASYASNQAPQENVKGEDSDHASH